MNREFSAASVESMATAAAADHGCWLVVQHRLHILTLVAYSSLVCPAAAGAGMGWTSSGSSPLPSHTSAAIGFVQSTSSESTPTPSPTLKAETANHCLSFDGASDWLDMIDLEIEGEFTLEAWVFLVGLINASDAIVGQVGLGQDVNCHDGYWRWYAPPGPNQFGDRVIAHTRMWEQTWTHVALTRHNGSLRLLLDGEVDATGYGTEVFMPKAIGRGNDNYGLYGFLEGKMDEIRIWNVYRDDVQISSNYWHPLTGAEQGLVAYWNFDEGSGQVAHDISGKGNDAPLGTSTAVEASDPTWVLSDIPGWSDTIPTPTETPLPATPTRTPTVTATATPTNGAPSQPLVTIEPEFPATVDDLFCTATGSVDPEGDPVSLSYAWYSNGELIAGGGLEPISGPSLSHVYTEKGDTVLCVVTPSDGVHSGMTGSDTVVIANTPPTAPAIHLLPETPGPSDGLAVWIEQQSTDVDGDYIAYLFQWYESTDGQDWTLRPELSGNESPFVQGQPEISRNYTQAGDYWRAVVTPVELQGKSSGERKEAVQATKQKGLVLGDSGSASVFVIPDFTADGAVNSKDVLVLEQAWHKRKADLPTPLRQVFFESRDSSEAKVSRSFLLKMMGGSWHNQQ